MAKKILITGATGNVGKRTIQSLIQKNGEFEVLAGVRNVQSKDDILLLPKIQAIHFDFEDEKSIHAALEQANILFLLRPPQLSDVKKYFEPLIRVAKEKNIQLFIEDDQNNAESFLNNGIGIILFDKEHNRDSEEIKNKYRVENWKQAEELIYRYFDLEMVV